MATSIGIKLGIDGEAEYRKQLNNIIQSTKTLDKQMEALQSSFSSETSEMEKNAKETELLQKKAEKLTDEVEMMQKMVDAAAEKFGESSTECQKWEASLAKAQTELNKTNAEIEAHQEAAESANSALGQLTDLIDSQTSELEELKDAYANAVLEFGEGSEQAEELASQITNLSSELETNQQRLDEVTQAAEDLTTAADDNKSALETLTDEIADQESELDNLRDSYIDAVLEFGEGSDEANELAGQIANLSSELQTNKDRLDDAHKSLQNVESTTEEAGKATDEMASKTQEVGSAMGELAGMVDSSFGNMVGAIANADVAGLMMEIADKVLGVVGNLWEMQLDFDEAQASISTMTGAIGSDLKEMQNIATQAWAAVANKDSEIEDFDQIVSALNTRLGATGDELGALTELFGIYATTLGVDGADAVNDLVDVMQKWSLTSEDNWQNVDSLNNLMGALTKSQQLSDVSVTELAQHLRDQSGTFQALGMDVNEALGFMVAYRDAGGSVSEITRAMDATINHLAGETDDLGGTWDSMINTMQTSDDKMTALSATAGDTGKTIQDVFGAKLAGRIYDTFHSAGVNADEFTAQIESDASKQSNAMMTSYAATRTDMDNFYVWWREHFQARLLSGNQEISDGVAEANERVANVTKDSGWAVKNVSDETMQALQDDFYNVESMLNSHVQIEMANDLAGLQSDSANVFSAVESDYYNAKNTLSTPIEVTISAPAIAYELSGQGGGTRITPYSGGRYAFARGYEQALILSAPTIFGAMGNNMLVGGDRTGNEIVVGESHLMDMFSKAIGGSGNNINVVINAAEGMNENELADYVIDKIQMQIIGSEAVHA